MPRKRLVDARVANCQFILCQEVRLVLVKVMLASKSFLKNKVLAGAD